MTPPLDLENLITVSTGWCVLEPPRLEEMAEARQENIKKEARREAREEVLGRVSEKSKVCQIRQMLETEKEDWKETSVGTLFVFNNQSIFIY